MPVQSTNKWITGIEPDEPLSRAARQVLMVRLAAVSGLVPWAALHSHEETEYVHQLRVATRRAQAALSAFAAVLPRRRRRKLQRMLRALRRAAGDARDCDVQLQRLPTEQTNDDPLRQSLRADLQARRRRSQKKIDNEYRRLKQDRFEHKIAKLLCAVRWRGKRGAEPSFGDVARESIGMLADRLFAASDDLTHVDQLHRLRIAAKRLRYAMEIFAGVFSAGFHSQLYREIEQLQERLGQLNDQATAVKRYRDRSHCDDAGIDQTLLEHLAAVEQKKLDGATRRFHRWWGPVGKQRVADQFQQYLAEMPADGDMENRQTPRTVKE